jgi:hypothetical protein
MSDNRPIVYEDRLLAFIDILGFSERVLRSGKDQKLGQEILHFFVSLKTLLARFQSDDFAVTLFSDTLCVSSREPPNFSSFCCGLSLIATSLLGLSYTVRGAVSRGLLHHKGDIIFGPCLVRAHNLENTLAMFPRIIIDPDLEVNLDPEGGLFEPIYADPDGLRCVNYLSPVLLEVVFRLMGLPAQQLRAEIKANIDRMLSATTDERALQKLRWLHHYAERTVSGPHPGEALINELVLKVRASTKNSA